MEPPYHPPDDSAKARGALGVIIARVTLVAFGGVKRVNRAIAAAATAPGGRGGSNPLILSTSRQTCICSLVFWLLIGVPFYHHCSRDLYSHFRVYVALTHQEEFVRLCSMTINMILLSFWWHSQLPSTRNEVRNPAYGGQRELNAPLCHCRTWVTRL